MYCAHHLRSYKMQYDLTSSAREGTRMRFLRWGAPGVGRVGGRENPAPSVSSAKKDGSARCDRRWTTTEIRFSQSYGRAAANAPATPKSLHPAACRRASTSPRGAGLRRAHPAQCVASGARGTLARRASIGCCTVSSPAPARGSYQRAAVGSACRPAPTPRAPHRPRCLLSVRLRWRLVSPL